MELITRIQTNETLLSSNPQVIEHEEPVVEEDVEVACEGDQLRAMEENI